MSSYHGWTHAPKEQGGTDPIPGATSGDLPWIRLKQLAEGQTWTATDTRAIIYDDIVNDYPATFDVYVQGAENWGVNFLEAGLYQATVRAYFDAGDAPTTNGVILSFANVDYDIFAPYDVFVEGNVIGRNYQAYSEITFRAQVADKFSDPWNLFVRMSTLGETATLYNLGGTYLEVRKLGSATTPAGLDNSLSG